MDLEVVERNDYYPFGLRWGVSSSPVTDNRYRYNGKEEQFFAGVPYIDYGARQYDPLLCRWLTQDELLEKYYGLNPYVFCSNSPFCRIDFDGKLDDEFYNSLGYKIYDTGIGNKTYVIRTHEKQKVILNSITLQAAIDTEQKIRSGNIVGDHMQNIIEIEPIEILNEMRNAIKDDGRGGNSDANNREYGGIVEEVSGKINNVTQGEIRGQENNGNAIVNIDTRGARSVFHSHPSAIRIGKNNLSTGSSRMPSAKDFESIGKAQGYLFQMRTHELIIFNDKGVEAIVPLTMLNNE